MNLPTLRIFRVGLPALAMLSFGLTGCFHHHEDAPSVGHVVIYDDKGYRHEGAYDHDDWHGGYYDDHHEFHDDPHDWHH